MDKQVTECNESGYPICPYCKNPMDVRGAYYPMKYFMCMPCGSLCGVHVERGHGLNVRPSTK